MERNQLGEEKIGRLLVRFAVPSVISMLVSALYNIVDQIFIGNGIGINGNAATNVAFPLSTLCTSLALLFGIGGAANFNLCMGAGEHKRAGKYVGNSIFLLLSSGILLCVLVRIFLQPLMLLFGATEDTLAYSLEYTGITSFGFPFLILSTGGSALIRADGSPKFSMVCMLSGAVINTIFDPLFIFGFQMGMAGAAWATVLGQIISGCMVLWYLLHFRSVRLEKQYFLPKLRCCLRVAALGTSNCFNQIAMMVVQVVMNNTMTFYGALSVYGQEIPLACSGIINKVNMIFFSLVIGISQGLQPITSFNYGAKKYGRVWNSYRLAVTAGTAISLVSFLCFQLFPRQIISLFGSGSEEYFVFAERYFRIFLFCTFINGIQPITSNFFTSMGKAPRGVLMALTRQVIFLLPLLVILPMFWGIDGVMYAGPIADTAAALLAIVLVVIERKKLLAMEKTQAA
ncbi:MAG TPA: MATE family efflux transporter [Candidatus Gallacutalibacter pullistercoris]|nr:MATE family efflux transporter [Candidatus Gallacutalibacter pullistercoris]